MTAAIEALNARLADLRERASALALSERHIAGDLADVRRKLCEVTQAIAETVDAIERLGGPPAPPARSRPVTKGGRR